MPVGTIEGKVPWFLVARELRGPKDSVIIERHDPEKPISRIKLDGDAARQVWRTLANEFPESAAGK